MRGFQCFALTVWHCISLHRTVSHCLSLHLTASHCISLHLAVSDRISSDCSSLYLTVSHFIHYISLHLTVSYCISLNLSVSHSSRGKSLYLSISHFFSLYLPASPQLPNSPTRLSSHSSPTSVQPRYVAYLALPNPQGGCAISPN